MTCFQEKTKEIKEWTEGEKVYMSHGRQLKKHLQLLKFQKEKRGSAFKILILENFPKLWRDLGIQVHEIHSSQKSLFQDSTGFPDDSVVKESTCQCRRLRFNPRVGKIPWRRKW